MNQEGKAITENSKIKDFVEMHGRRMSKRIAENIQHFLNKIKFNYGEVITDGIQIVAQGYFNISIN